MSFRLRVWLGLSLLLVVALVALWVRSYRTVSAVVKYSPTSRRWVGLARGELIYDSYTDARFQDASQGWEWLNYPASSVKRAAEFPRVLGFSFGRPRRQFVQDTPLSVYRHFVSIPLWFITASTLAILLRGWRVIAYAPAKKEAAADQTKQQADHELHRA